MYYEFLDYRAESQECFINKNNKIIAIVDMCSLPQYWFYNIFYTKTNNVDFGKEDYFRLYPKKAKRLTFENEKNYDNGYTINDIIKLDINNMKITI